MSLTSVGKLPQAVRGSFPFVAFISSTITHVTSSIFNALSTQFQSGGACLKGWLIEVVVCLATAVVGVVVAPFLLLMLVVSIVWRTFCNVSLAIVRTTEVLDLSGKAWVAFASFIQTCYDGFHEGL